MGGTMRSESVEVKTAAGIDLAVLVDIFNSSRAGAGCYSGEEINTERFTESIEGEEVHVAVLRGKIVGFVSVWAAERFIHHLYVLPQYQGVGAGSSLLRICEEIYGLPLSLKCDTCNKYAQRFYRGKGWWSSDSGAGPDGPWERLHSPGRMTEMIGCDD